MLSNIFIYFFQTTIKKNKSKVKSWCLILSYFSCIKQLVFFEGVGGLPSKQGLSLDIECLNKGLLLSSKVDDDDALDSNSRLDVNGRLGITIDSNSITKTKKGLINSSMVLRHTLYKEQTALVKELLFIENKTIRKQANEADKLKTFVRKPYYRWGRQLKPRHTFVHRFTRFLLKRNLAKQKRKILEFSKFEFRVKYFNIGVLDLYLYKLRPLHLLLLCLDKVSPLISLRLKRSGGTFYRIPRPLNEHKGIKTALRWVFKQILVRNTKRNSKTLLRSFILIQNNEGPVIELQTTLYKVAIQNRPFVRFLKLGK